MLIYVIQSGDSLWAISQRYGVSVDAIVDANEMLNPDRLVVGQAIVIPTGNRYHTVQPGETLWGIANQYGTTFEAIARANQIQNPALIYSGKTLVIPAGTWPVTEVNGYLTLMGEAGAERVREVGEDLTYISPFSYHIQTDGGLQPLDDTQVLTAAGEKIVAPLMVITNFSADGFNSQNAHVILSNPDLQDTLISNILDTMQSKGYRGLNIDFEYVLPEDRENYNQFLRRVVDRLHPQYLVSTALAPKESANQQGLLYTAHDYPAHGRIADFVILMTYEWGYAAGPPLAIAPINKVRDVLDYAVSVIPSDKILMGIPNYGRDWRLPFVAGETIARTITGQQAVDLAATHNVAIQYNETYQAPHFQYVDDTGDTHEVWYEDARSMEAKFATVKDYNLRGISYWVLNYRLPQSWLLQEKNFQTRKI